MQELGRLGSRVEQRLRRVFPERRFLLHPAEAAEGLLGVDVTRDNDLLFILVADYVTDAWQVEEHLTHLCDALLAAHRRSHHQTLWTEITQYELSVISFRLSCQKFGTNFAHHELLSNNSSLETLFLEHIRQSLRKGFSLNGLQSCRMLMSPTKAIH